MRSLRQIPLAVLALLPLAAPAPACPDCGILPGPPTAAPEIFSLTIAGGESGYEMRFTLYEDRTFEMAYMGAQVLVETAAPEVYREFIHALRTGGFLDLAPQRASAGKVVGDPLVTSLSAYGGKPSYAYAAEDWALVPQVVQDVQAAFEDLILDVIAMSGLVGA